MNITEKDKQLKLMLADHMLKEIPNMSLKELKTNYEYMLLDNFFLKNYRAYNSEQINLFTEETKEDLRKYFTLGMNMYKTNVSNAEFYDIL